MFIFIPLFYSLFTIPKEFFESFPTLQLIRKLYDNYDIKSTHAEIILSERNIEENTFINSLLNTEIMISAMDFLANKGYFKKDLNTYEHILKKIWFGLYSRSNHTKVGSSGFEHVFLLEENKNKRIVGLHNWIFFATEECNKHANYLGYINKKELGDVSIFNIFEMLCEY
jgi:poly(U)-specific endoribonuclease